MLQVLKFLDLVLVQLEGFKENKHSALQSLQILQLILTQIEIGKTLHKLTQENEQLLARHSGHCLASSIKQRFYRLAESPTYCPALIDILESAFCSGFSERRRSCCRC